MSFNRTPLSANVPSTPGDDSTHWFGWFWFVSSQIWPRVFILAFWIFGHGWVRDSFDGHWAIPIVGFFVAPYTTMTWPLMWGLTSNGVHGLEWVAIGVAALLDLATWIEGGQLIGGLVADARRRGSPR